MALVVKAAEVMGTISFIQKGNNPTSIEGEIKGLTPSKLVSISILNTIVMKGK